MPDSTLSELLLTKPSVNRVNRSSSTEHNPSESDDAIHEAQCRIGRRPQMMIAFRKCSGQVVVRPYSMLQGIESDDADRSFRMDFANLRVTIVGENLQQMFDYACEHRVLQIRESDRTEAIELDRIKIVVNSILIT